MCVNVSVNVGMFVSVACSRPTAQTASPHKAHDPTAMFLVLTHASGRVRLAAMNLWATFLGSNSGPCSSLSTLAGAGLKPGVDEQFVKDVKEAGKGLGAGIGIPGDHLGPSPPMSSTSLGGLIGAFAWPCAGVESVPNRGGVFVLLVSGWY